MKKNKQGSWKWIRNNKIRQWARNKEQEKIAGTEKKNGKEGHVYIFSLGYDNLYKIGCTYNIQSRLKTLKASCPNMKCVWSCWTRNMNELEKILHVQFKNHKVERELFELSGEFVVKANNIANNYNENH